MYLSAVDEESLEKELTTQMSFDGWINNDDEMTLHRTELFVLKVLAFCKVLTLI